MYGTQIDLRKVNSQKYTQVGKLRLILALIVSRLLDMEDKNLLLMVFIIIVASLIF